MSKLTPLFVLIGLIVATALIARSGWQEVLQAVAQVGWLILPLALLHIIPLTLSGTGWRVLLPGRSKKSFPLFIYFMWLRASVNNLMPVARIGGEIAAIRVMTAHGIKKTTAIALTVVELTLSIMAVFLFIVIGVLLFALRVSDQNIVTQLAWGLLLSSPILMALVIVQKIGFFGLLSKLFRLMFRDTWIKIIGDASRLDRAVSVLYRRKKKILLCAFMQFLAWVSGTLEIWCALVLLHHAVPLTEAFMIEALIQASSSAAFAIPGALGVQEAGFLLFGGMLGLPVEIAAALAVLRRCRDLICYLPGIIVWQIHEGKKWVRA